MSFCESPLATERVSRGLADDSENGDKHEKRCRLQQPAETGGSGMKLGINDQVNKST